MSSVVKHNKLIETSYKMNSREQFLLLHLVSEISKQDTGFKEHRFDASEIEKILNFDGKRRVSGKKDVFEVMRNINSCVVRYEKGSIEGETTWFQYYEFDNATNTYHFSLSNKLGSYLLELKDHFTSYNFINIIHLSATSTRLFELLKRHEYKGTVELSVEDIRFYLGLEEYVKGEKKPKKKYPKFYDFKRYVLEKGSEELDLYTDIKFTYQISKKKGKKVTHLLFKITKNKPVNILEISGPSKEDDYKALYSKSKYLVYEFLIEKEVNSSFILNNILVDAVFSYEVVKGYEDLLIKNIWTHFDKKSKAKKKAGVFVNWWKKGYFTNDEMKVKFTEALYQITKNMTEKEKKFRTVAKGMSHNEYEAYVAELIADKGWDKDSKISD